MKVAYVFAAAVASLLLMPAASGAAMPIGQGLLVSQRGPVVEVKLHHHKAPVGTQYWITTPNAGVSSGSWRSESFQSYGASPGQPGSPTYAPYAGLPPLRYYGN